MGTSFGCSNQGDRTENLDRYGHFFGEGWFVSFIIDGFYPSIPHYIESLYENFRLNLDALSKSIKNVGLGDIEEAIDKSFGVSDGEGKASIVIVVFSNDEQKVYHAGDSRAYFIDTKSRTKDHSRAQFMIDNGLSPAGSLQQHPFRRYLIKSVDKYSSLGSLEQKNIPFCKRIMLCSDGFWSLSDQESIYEIQNIESASLVFHEALKTEIGKRDNVTILYVENT